MRNTIKQGNLTFHPNFKLNAELRKAGVFDDELKRLADLAALGAKELAVKQAFDTGAYFGSIRGRLDQNRRGLRVGLVVADDYKAHWVERGWQHTSHGKPTGTAVRGKNILRRGARRAGLRVRAPRKR